jgi:hypothetical protein
MSSRRERTALYFTAAASFAMYLYWLLPKGVLKRSYYSLVNPRAFHTDAALSFDAFLAHQGAVSWRRLLDNVHPPGTSAGCVVASPSRFKPNYFYQVRLALIPYGRASQPWSSGRATARSS